MWNSEIKDLNNLKYVEGSIDLRFTPIGNSYTIEQIRSMVDVKGDIYMLCEIF